MAVAAGLAASAIALVGFGLDSAIEVVAAVVVLRRLTTALKSGEPDLDKERQALRFISLAFFGLAIFLIVREGIALIDDERPDTSWVGITITGDSVIVVPVARGSSAGWGADELSGGDRRCE